MRGCGLAANGVVSSGMPVYIVEFMKKNDRSTDAFTLYLMNRWETHWMWNESLFLIACGWVLAPFLSALMVLSWLTFLWMIGRYPKCFFL